MTKLRSEFCLRNVREVIVVYVTDVQILNCNVEFVHFKILLSGISTLWLLTFISRLIVMCSFGYPSAEDDLNRSTAI